MVDVVGAATTLVGVINSIYHQAEQRAENVQVLEELRGFLQGLQKYIQQTQEKALVLRNNSAVWALGALKEDLDHAILDASNILNKGFVRSLWDATKIQSRIQALRERVMTSFQTRLSMAALDVAIEGKQAQDAFQEAMLKVNKELQKSCYTTSISVKQEQKLALREELRQSLQPITIALESHGHRIEAAVSTIHSFQPQTSDAEKFFQDVLAALDGLSVSNNQGKGESASGKRPVTHAASGHAKRGSGSVKWYEDPITWETMCDPVKATDGHTYDRWTILRKSGHLATSPFHPDDPRPFHIAIDDVDVRSRLFQKFPAQEFQFKAKRAAYRDAALGEAQLGHFADSASMLRHVLEWAPFDIECKEKLRYVQCQMRAAEGNSIPSPDDAYQRPLAREVDQRRQDAGIFELNNTSSSSATPDDQHQQQLYPSRLDIARSNTHLLELSTDGLSCRFRSNAASEESNTVGAAIADKPVPMRDEGRRSTTFFYFEIRIEELADGGSCKVGLGFTGSESFHNNVSPGCYPNSCGYHGDDGYIFANGMREQGGLPTARRGDTMGAGIHHGHKEIFFVHNGALTAVISNTLAGTVMPIVAIGSRSAYVKVAFNASAFLPEQRPSRLVLSQPDVQRSRVSLSRDGLVAQYVFHAEPALPRFVPVVSFLADYGACFRHPSQMYYFELTVIEKGFDGSIGIGFASRNSFQAHMMPGWYANSCAYHGDDGKLFFGCGSMGQRFGPTFSSGDTIGAGIDHASSTVFFIKNGKKVGHTSRLRTSCALYPIIGWRSPGAKVRLNFGQAPFHYNTAASNTLNLDIMEQPTRLSILSSSVSKHVSLSEDGLTASYTYPRSQFGTQCPAFTLIANRAVCTFRRRSTEVYYFELTVLDRGEGGHIAIGFCNQDQYDCFHVAGEHLHSCAYHGDNGRFLTGDATSSEYGPTFSTKDIVGAGIHFSSNTIFFAKNGHLAGHINSMDISHALIPTIGLRSANEKVHLNFGQAPFSLDTTSTHFPWR